MKFTAAASLLALVAAPLALAQSAHDVDLLGHAMMRRSGGNVYPSIRSAQASITKCLEDLSILILSREDETGKKTFALMRKCGKLMNDQYIKYNKRLPSGKLSKAELAQIERAGEKVTPQVNSVLLAYVENCFQDGWTCAPIQDQLLRELTRFNLAVRHYFVVFQKWDYADRELYKRQSMLADVGFAYTLENLNPVAPTTKA